MSSSLTRRQFVRVATLSTIGFAGAAGLSAWPRRARAASDATAAADAAAQPPLYAFPLLGDLHFDKMAHHDMDWVRRQMPNDVRQIEGYVQGTEKYHPILFAEIRDLIKAQGAVPVPFVVQIGDVVEGVCGSYDLHALQLRDTMQFIDHAGLGVPFLVSKGNHDITGPGAPEAFDQVFLPWLSKQAAQELTGAHYVHRHGEDAFVFFDAYKPDLDWLENVLRANKDARHLFFVIHPPVVPYNARANWHVFAAERQSASRARLLDLLGQRHAIVLSGHLHKYGLLTRRTERGGLFSQLAVSSIIRNDREQPRDQRDGIDKYTPDLLELEPRFSPGTLEQRRALLAAEAPHIQQFEYADLPGYALVKVYADRVDAEIYAGVGAVQWKSRGIDVRTTAKSTG